MEKFKYLGCNVRKRLMDGYPSRPLQPGKTVDTQYHYTKGNIALWTRILGNNNILDSRNHAADMKVLRLMKDVTRRDKIQNADIMRSSTLIRYLMS